jgi:hypothetical protein
MSSFLSKGVVLISSFSTFFMYMSTLKDTEFHSYFVWAMGNCTISSVYPLFLSALSAPLSALSTPLYTHTQARNSGKSDESKEARRLELAARQAEKAERDAAEAERVKVHGMM